MSHFDARLSLLVTFISATLATPLTGCGSVTAFGSLGKADGKAAKAAEAVDRASGDAAPTGPEDDQDGDHLGGRSW